MNTPKKYIKKITITGDKSSAKARAKRLKMIRNLANLSRKQLCELCNINIHTLIGWEVARFGGLPLDGAEKIIQGVTQKGVHCTLDWLIHEIGAGPTVITDYVIAKKDAEKKVKKNSTNIDEKQLLEEILFFRKQYNDAITLLLTDDGMSPFYNAGDYVAGIKQYGEKIKALIEKDCIVQLSSGEIILRNLHSGNEAKKYNLVCINPQTTVVEPIIYNVEITSAAPAIRLYRR